MKNNENSPILALPRREGKKTKTKKVSFSAMPLQRK